MNDDFDDLEMRPEEEGGGPSGRALLPRRRSNWPWVGGLIVLIVAGVGAFLLTKPQPPLPARPAPATEAPRPAATATPTPDPSLPALDESDAFMRQLASGLSKNPELARWLARTALVRTLTAVVANIASGETPRRHLEFLTPRQRFHATAAGGRTVADPTGYAGYDLFGDAVASIDARAAAEAYATSEPLFEAAFHDLGGQDFRTTLDAAIRALLTVPVPPPDAELRPGVVGFQWASPDLEGLTAAQKQFLRTGPRNVRLVQAKLRDLQAALADRLSKPADAQG
jgi:hypothetical protein